MRNRASAVGLFDARGCAGLARPYGDDQLRQFGGRPVDPGAQRANDRASEGQYAIVPVDTCMHGLKRVDVAELYDAQEYRPKVRHVLSKPMFLY